MNRFILTSRVPADLLAVVENWGARQARYTGSFKQLANLTEQGGLECEFVH